MKTLTAPYTIDLRSFSKALQIVTHHLIVDFSRNSVSRKSMTLTNRNDHDEGADRNIGTTWLQIRTPQQYE